MISVPSEVSNDYSALIDIQEDKVRSTSALCLCCTMNVMRRCTLFLGFS